MALAGGATGVALPVALGGGAEAATGMSLPLALSETALLPRLSSKRLAVKVWAPEAVVRVSPGMSTLPVSSMRQTYTVPVGVSSSLTCCGVAGLGAAFFLRFFLAV